MVNEFYNKVKLDPVIGYIFNDVVKVNWDKNSTTNKQIITDLSNRLLFNVDENVQKDMEAVLKYDFNPKEENANFSILRLFNYIVKTPEFQLI